MLKGITHDFNWDLFEVRDFKSLVSNIDGLLGNQKKIVEFIKR